MDHMSSGRRRVVAETAIAHGYQPPLPILLRRKSPGRKGWQRERRTMEDLGDFDGCGPRRSIPPMGPTCATPFDKSEDSC